MKKMDDFAFTGAVAASVLLLAAAPAAAQESAVPVAAVPSDEAAPACELHLFPSQNFLVQKTGWLAGFGMVGAIADAAINADKKVTIDGLMREYLSGEGQAASLESLDLAALLNRPGVRVVAAAPLTRPQVKALKATRGRLSSSKASCYSELVVGKIFYQKGPIGSGKVTTKFYYREFGGGAPRALSGKIMKSVHGFPPKKREDLADAQAALRETFARSFDAYARKKIYPAPDKR
jgi:hypothetical protein